MKYRKYRKYKPKSKPKTKRKHKLKIKGRNIFGTALKNFGSYWYRGLGRRWEEKKLRNEEAWYAKKSNLT